MLDVNALANAFGRRRIQDDYTLHIAHASYISDFDVSYDTNRLQKSIAPSAMYQSAEAIKEFGQHLIERLAESIKVIRQSHPIKLIIVDLDDTLWRGVAADDDRPDWEFTEGWPLGLVEALLIFKRRGGLLAICSKNDHDGTAARFEKIWKGRISLSDFASVKINFDRKSANIEEILNEVNILAESTLFIDDNPREIEEVREAFSQLRTLSAQHYDWRRVILTSAETQSFLNTTESQNRTELIKAKIQRDSARKGLSTGDWLASLEIKQRHKLISDQNDSDFERAFELLNKTNQFNTTGRRWTRDEIVTRMAGGAYFVASFLRDRLVDNGLVGLSLVDGNEILQAVLSCRVFNMEAEYSSGHVVCNLILENHDTVVGRFAETGKNFTCREYFKNMGFEKNGDIFVTAKLPPHPTHIESTIG